MPPGSSSSCLPSAREFQVPESTDAYHFLLLYLEGNESVNFFELNILEEFSALIVDVRFHTLIY